MIVKVTQEHIDHGVRCHGLSCPLALAIQQATGDPKWRVGGVIANNGRIDVGLPDSAIQFRKAFDDIGRGMPFEFELPIER